MFALSAELRLPCLDSSQILLIQPIYLDGRILSEREGYLAHPAQLWERRPERQEVAA